MLSQRFFHIIIRDILHEMEIKSDWAGKKIISLHFGAKQSCLKGTNYKKQSGKLVSGSSSFSYSATKFSIYRVCSSGNYYTQFKMLMVAHHTYSDHDLVCGRFIKRG